MAVPIWKDYYFTLNVTSIEYRLKLYDTDEVIYTGKAFAKPDESSVSIKVNDICADYIGQIFPSGDSFTLQPIVRTFVFEYKTGNVWNTYDSVEFIYDWSYDHLYLVTTDGLSFPIREEIDGRQRFLYTLLKTLSTTIVTLTYTDETTTELEVDTSEGDGTIQVDLSEYFGISEIASVSVDGRVFPVDLSACHNYVLYYVNAYGGWDSLAVKGRVSETDNYTRHNHSSEYDNTSVINRGTRNFVNEIEKTFTLQTGWVDELGSSRMHHLLGSTDVYLHDLVNDAIMPVVLTNVDCPYKTYGGEGNKLINYTIEATLANERTRR